MYHQLSLVGDRTECYLILDCSYVAEMPVISLLDLCRLYHNMELDLLADYSPSSSCLLILSLEKHEPG